MPTKMSSEVAAYPVIRFINDDLNTSVSRFATKWGKAPSVIINWQGRGADKKNIKSLPQLPIWVIQYFSMETNLSMDAIFEKLSDYYLDWERDNRFYLLRDGIIKPVHAADYLSQKLGQSFHTEAGESFGLNSTDSWFEDFILEVNRSVDGMNEDSIIVYKNDADQKQLFKITQDQDDIADDEIVANLVLKGLKLNK